MNGAICFTGASQGGYCLRLSVNRLNSGFFILAGNNSRPRRVSPSMNASFERRYAACRRVGWQSCSEAHGRADQRGGCSVTLNFGERRRRVGCRISAGDLPLHHLRGRTIEIGLVSSITLLGVETPPTRQDPGRLASPREPSGTFIYSILCNALSD